MSGPRDDFIDALTYQVKEEVINNYFRERLILEEEIGEYQQAMNQYRDLGEEVRQIRDDLACLLVSPQNFREFFRLLGFFRPPLARFPHRNVIGRGPTCPIGLTPKGFTKRAKFVALTLQTYARLTEMAAIGREAAQNLFTLAVEINSDIKKFHLNYDLMTIINFIKSLDVESLARKKILGENFSAAELSSLEQNMMIKKLNPRAEGVRAWPDLPSPKTAEKLTTNFLRELFKQEQTAIMPALTKRTR